MSIDHLNHGIGIKKEHLDKILLIFQRLHSTSSYEGTGIGLTTCEKIMSLHSGKIDVESKSRKGSAFMISLPT